MTEQLPIETPTEETEEYKELFIFEKAKTRLNLIIGQWSSDIRDAKLRRAERYVKLDIERLRQNGDIEEDETFIPDRVIDTNIMREKPDILNFLVGTNRLAIFDCISNPELNENVVRRLEKEVSKGLTYNGWYAEFDSVVDGSLLHGKDYIEVVFDPSKPLHVGFEHISFDKLFYTRGVADVQDSDLVIRRYELTANKLKKFVKKNGFNPEQVDLILNQGDKSRKKDEVLPIYKCYYKFEDVTYVGWFTNTGVVTDWLKAPEKLFLGVKDFQGGDVDIDMYPIFTFIYKKDEQEDLIEYRGRGFLDGPAQEAATSILTAFVNGTMRASGVYASPKTDDGETPDMKQLDVELVNGGIYAKPLDFWSIPYPDATMLQAIYMLGTKNAEVTGKSSFAVTNRKDARKTAKELEVAVGQEAKITSTQVASFSEFLRSVFAFAWKIIQSQAIQGQITLLLTKTEVPINPNIPELGSQPRWTNDVETLSQTFDIRPAGDVDVVEAQATIAKMQTDWPVMQNSPLATQFLVDYVRLNYPFKGEQYAKILQSTGPQQLIASLATLVQAFASPEEIAALPPDKKLELQNIQQQVAQYLAANSPTNENNSVSKNGGKAPA